MSTVMKVSFVGINICTLQTFHLNTTSHLSPSQPTVLNEAARKNVELLQVMQKKIFLLLLFPFFRIAPSPWLVSYSHFLVGVCSLWSTVLHSRTIILAILRVIAVKYPPPPFVVFLVGYLYNSFGHGNWELCMRLYGMQHVTSQICECKHWALSIPPKIPL